MADSKETLIQGLKYGHTCKAVANFLVILLSLYVKQVLWEKKSHNTILVMCVVCWRLSLEEYHRREMTSENKWTI